MSHTMPDALGPSRVRSLASLPHAPLIPISAPLAAPAVEYYSTYLHCNTTWLVKAGDVVSKGQVVGYSGASSNGYAHLHFEIRRGGRTQRDSVNPWSWLPYPDTADGHTVEILSVVSTPVAAPAAAAPAAAPPAAAVAAAATEWSAGPGTYNVTVRAAALKAELDLAGMSIVALDVNGQEVPQAAGWRHSFDYESLNRANTGEAAALDNPVHGNIRLDAERFTVGSKYPYAKELATFTNMKLPLEATTLRATAADVRGNVVTTEWATPWSTTTVKSAEDYVRYEAGGHRAVMLPIIISVPHGGSKYPKAIPFRKNGCYTSTSRTLLDGTKTRCDYTRGCGTTSSSKCKVYTSAESYTRSVATAMSHALFRLTGGRRPFMVKVNLRRSRMDGNRGVNEATGGDPIATAAYVAQREFLRWASTNATTLCPLREFTRTPQRALFLDLHGQDHAEGWTEFGYSLSRTDLGKTDAAIDASESMLEKTPIRGLVDTFASGSHGVYPATLSEAVRGPGSLGSQMAKRGYSSVPSEAIPGPGAEGRYYSGGYNTRMLGSRYVITYFSYYSGGYNTRMLGSRYVITYFSLYSVYIQCEGFALTLT